MESRTSTHWRLFLAAARLVVTLVVVFGMPSFVTAQCAFDHTTASSSGYSAKLTTTLVQAFVSCGDVGGNTPNVAALGGGVPACSPPETFNQLGGSPANGWRFSQVPGQSWGRVIVRRTTGGANLPGYPPVLSDLSIRVTLKHIVETDGHGVAQGTGTLSVVFRATFDDYDTGDVTAIDFPFGMAVPLIGGSADVTKVLGTDFLIPLGVTRFPDCTNIEVVSIAVQDRNGTTFAVPGLRMR